MGLLELTPELYLGMTEAMNLSDVEIDELMGYIGKIPLIIEKSNLPQENHVFEFVTDISTERYFKFRVVALNNKLQELYFTEISVNDFLDEIGNMNLMKK